MRDVEQMLPPESASLSKSERDGANSTAAQSAEKLESLIRSVGEASSGEIDRVISQQKTFAPCCEGRVSA